MQLARRAGNCPLALLEELRSRSAGQREAAALALGNLNESAHVASDALAQALSDKSARVRLAAAQALARLGLSPSALAG
jgi:HEAT repeat protein